MTISIIAAVAKNRAIGYKNKLLYSIGDDMKRFKALTTGHTVIMGRKTFESLPFGALPNRRNIVISNSKKHIDGCECMNSINDAIHSCKNEDEIFIIGGGEIYRQALPIADRLYLTIVHTAIYDADTFFPEVEEREWREVGRESFERGEKFGRPFEFVVLERRR